MQEEIQLFEAIATMRSLTNEGKPFSITWMSYERSKNATSGVKHMENCLLRKASTKAQNKYIDSMLNLFDTDSKDNRVCWQPAIMYFNGIKIKP